MGFSVKIKFNVLGLTHLQVAVGVPHLGDSVIVHFVQLHAQKSRNYGQKSIATYAYIAFQYTMREQESIK